MIRALSICVIVFAALVAADMLGWIPAQYTKFYLPTPEEARELDTGWVKRLTDSVRAFGNRGF